MKNKKGAWSVIRNIVLAIALVAFLAYITIPSIRTSLIMVFEEGKKMLGIEEAEAKESTAKAAECSIKRFYWNKNKAKVNEDVLIIVEASEGCDGRKININVFNDRNLRFDKEYRSYEAEFSENKASIDLRINKKGDYYFKAKLDDYETQQSERIKIE